MEVQNQPAAHKKDAVRWKTRDRTASKHILGNSGIGTQKNDIMALKIEEPAYEGGLHQSYDACTKLDLVGRAETASDHYPIGFRGMNDELIILSAADERKRCEQSSSEQLEEGEIVENLMHHDKLSADTPLKENMKKKRSAITVSTGRKNQHRLGNNSSKRRHDKCANIGFSECAKLASDSTLSTEVKENKASEKRDHQLFSQQLRESDPEPGRVLHRVSSCSSSLGSSKKKKTNTSSEGNLEDQRPKTLFAQHLKEHKWLDMRTQCSDTSTKKRGINLSNHRNENRESEASEDRTSTSHHTSNLCKEFSKDSTISSMVDRNICVEPVIKPIWR